MPCCRSVVTAAAGRWKADIALGPTFSNHVWSTIWLAIAWPRERFKKGKERWMVAGKNPSILEKLWRERAGVTLNCFEVREASSRATKRPIIVTIKALSFRRGGMVITGVLEGRKFEVMIRPATMLPHARRLIGLITEGLFSLIGDRAGKRG